MKRQLAILAFMAMVVFGLCGAASAAEDLSVDNKYLDEEGNEIDTTEVGDIVVYQVDVSNDGDEDAEDVTDVVGEDTTSTIDFDLLDEFVTQGEINPDTGDWVIGTVQAGETESLIQKLEVKSTGSELFQEDLYQGETLVDSSVATLVSEEPSPEPVVQGKTVAMQTTGIPFAPLAVALFMVIGGLAYTRKP
jgi:hypothetical protein